MKELELLIKDIENIETMYLDKKEILKRLKNIYKKYKL